MMTAELPRKKRAWTPWYRLPIPPLCPVHGEPMIAASTRAQPDGLVIQHRSCPHAGCAETAVTTYRR